MPDWYFAKDDKQQGPVTTGTLREMADNGDLRPSDMVWHAGMANWAEASTSKELFPSGAQTRQHAPRTTEPEPQRRTRPRRRSRDDYDDDDYDDEYDRRRPRRLPPPARRGLSTGAWVAIIGGTVGGVALVGIIIWVIVANAPRREGRQLFPPTTVNARLDRGDRRFHNKYAEFYPIRLTKNRQYVIEMTTNDFDAFLYLQDPFGNTVAFNDDDGAGLNSRIVFRPRASGRYQIVATSLGGGQTGRFTLRVR